MADEGLNTGKKYNAPQYSALSSGQSHPSVREYVKSLDKLQEMSRLTLPLRC